MQATVRRDYLSDQAYLSLALLVFESTLNIAYKPSRDDTLMPLIDITNQKFGRLLVLSRASNSLQGDARWLCQCDCGRTSVSKGGSLRIGATRSCGYCANATHGHASNKSRTRTYRAWTSMLSRCRRPGDASYLRYGGRGITVCERWELFENFLEDIGEAPPGLTLDRIDNDGNYEPGNCKWSTWKEQAANRRPVTNRRPTTTREFIRRIRMWRVTLDLDPYPLTAFHEVVVRAHRRRGFSPGSPQAP
jgi:hypothetical protein